MVKKQLEGQLPAGSSVHDTTSTLSDPPIVPSFLPTIPHSWSPAPAEKFVLAQEKEKLKTRGEPAQQPAEEDEEPEAPSDDSLDSPDGPRKLLNKRSYDILERLIGDEQGKNREGNVRWRDFAKVVTDVGLSLDTVNGSEFAITGTPLGENKRKRSSRMVVHKPHDVDDTKETYRLQEYGKRLKQKFGWKWRRFGVKGQDEE